MEKVKLAVFDVKLKGTAAGLSNTNDRVDPNIPWIEFDRYSFSNDDDWAAICEIAGKDPSEVEKVRLYVHDIACE